MAPGSNSRIDPVTTDVVAVSADTLLNVRSYICDICGKHFSREQNLELHLRTHNLPFNLRRNPAKDRKKVYICPEPTCIHHDPSHAIGDYGGLKKHFFRKHVSEKNHKCNSCSKAYAAEVDLKAHLKICGKKKHKCSCGIKFEKKRDFNFHMDHDCCASNQLSRNGLGNNLFDVTTNNHTESFMIGSTSSYPTTFNMEHNTARITTNHNNSTFTPQIPTVQNTPYNCYPNLSHYESQLHDFEAYQGSQTLHASSFPKIQQIQQDSQINYTEGSNMQMLMGEDLSIDNFELDHNFDVGSYYGHESVHNTSMNAMMDYGYVGGAGSFIQDYGHGYFG